MKPTISHLAKPGLLTTLSLAAALSTAANAQTETVLHNFNYSTGFYPDAGLITDPSGNLYGTTSFGGQAGFGVLFQLTRSGRYTVLHTFAGVDGAIPYAPVARDASGNLYGTTTDGGTADVGVIYKLHSSGQYTVLHDFQGVDGSYPYAPVVLDEVGNLYGTADGGGPDAHGVVYEVSSGGVYTVLHSFTGGADGQNPGHGVVVLDSAGNLYGTTYYGGTGQHGVVYKIDPNGNETILHSFSGGLDGGSPFGSLILDPAGNLYGTTYYGGAHDDGVVFKLDPNGIENVLHSFAGTPDGAYSQAGLRFDAFGNLWGVTDFGGTSNFGTVFKIDRVTRQESVYYSFSGTNGGPFINAPLLIVNGNIYGAAYYGGAGGGGVVFKITP